jgi:hypothetical protein
MTSAAACLPVASLPAACALTPVVHGGASERICRDWCGKGVWWRECRRECQLLLRGKRDKSTQSISPCAVNVL